MPHDPSNSTAAVPVVRPSSRRERRKDKRVRVTGLWCDRGQVVDFSSRGMRLTTIRRWPEGLVRTITLHLEGQPHTLQARCVWCRQDSLFSHSVGVAFEDVPAESARVMDTLVQSGEMV